MKCQQPGSDQEAAVTVLADGEECIEFVLPSASKSSPDVIECFVPISDGQKITLQVKYSGTVYQGVIDIVADGNFVLNRRFKCPKGARHLNYHYKLDKFRCTVTHEEDQSHELELPRVDEGELQTKKFSGYYSNNSSIGYGIGSIAVIIYTKQRESQPNTTDPSYADFTTLKNRLDGFDGGIKPNYELTFMRTNDNIRRDNQTQHLREAKGERPGLYPLVTFIFHYRSHDAIRQAGFVLDTLDTRKLPPMGEQPAALKTTEQSNAIESSKQQQKGRSTSLGSSTQAPTPNQPKRKLMNQPFPGPRKSSTIGLSTLDMNANNTASPPISAVGSSTPAPAPAQPKRKLMNQPFPPPRKASNIGPSMLSMNANDAPPLPNLALGLREAARLGGAPPALPKNPGPGRSTRRPIFIESDSESDNDDMPPPPIPGVGLRKPAPTAAAPQALVTDPGPSLSARRPSLIESDSRRDDDGMPPPPEADLRADQQSGAPVVPAMASESGRVYLPGASQDGAAGKRKRDSDAAASEDIFGLESEWAVLEAKASKIAGGKKRTMGK